MNDRQLGETFTQAMRIWDGMKAAGASLTERAAALEKTLRAAWPFTRDWKFLCASCDDYGLVMAECPGDASCGRPKAHLAHSYGTPCWCDKGKPFRPKSPRVEDAIATIGKTKPPSRLGRF